MFGNIHPDGLTNRRRPEYLGILKQMKLGIWAKDRRFPVQETSYDGTRASCNMDQGGVGSQM